ncbi:MAG: prepilin-type N-terminal cleavage/methylation domain-containing protein [Candidatus Jacksonbacteria bacterium]|jgi:hypothetical protein|nr:prepilin-type N-terminal cleavage/methylation domain-containing protein [Candidatus Jacksonbacteria bacterium]
MKSIKSTAGFTLLELMVTTSLIIIISAAMFVNLRDYNSSKQLDLAGNEFVFQVERMRNFTQTGKKFNDLVSPGGWGVQFSAGDENAIQYILFADMDSNEAYTAGEQFSSATLPHTVYFKQISSASLGVPVDIVYKPSYGDYYIDGERASSDINITLGLPQKLEERVITIRKTSGAFELE